MASCGNKRKSSDQELVAAYAGVGNNYAQQRAFRQKWVAEQLAQLKRTKSTAEEVKRQELTEGQYEPFDIIVDKEGGSTRLAAVKAAVNYVMCCVKFQKAGMHVQGNKWNHLPRHDSTMRVPLLGERVSGIVRTIVETPDRHGVVCRNRRQDAWKAH